MGKCSSKFSKARMYDAFKNLEMKFRLEIGR